MQANIFQGVVELTTQLLRLISILWLPLSRTNNLGNTSREDCRDPLHLWVIKWLLDSGATSHMTGSKDILVDIKPHRSNDTFVQFGDASTSKVVGLGKVIISPDTYIEKFMLVDTLAFNLLSIRQLAKMGLRTFFDVDVVTLLWSKSLKVAFDGYVENNMYVVDFSKAPTKPRLV